MNVSASALQHLFKCPGSRGLTKYRHTNKGARRGHAFHAVIEMARHQGVDAALAHFRAQPREDIRVWVEHFDFDAFLALAGDAHTERAYAWDSDTGIVRHLGDQLDRSYEITETEIPGTADYLTIDESHGVLLDLKTGRTWVPSPEWNWQLRFLALCAARAHDLETIEAHIAHVDDEGGCEYKTPAYWTAEDLDGFEAKLLGVLSKDNLVAGEHCSYCPAFAECPIQVKTATALVEMDVTPGALSAEVIASVYPKLLAIKRATDKVEKAIKGYVETNGPVPLEDGKELAMVPGSWTKTKAKVAMKVLEEMCGDAVLGYLGVSQTDVKFAAERAGVPPKAVLEEIDKRGGMETLKKRPGLRAVKAK